MKCTRCRARAEIKLPSHNSAFCRACFLLYFRRQVERTITKEKMFTRDERVLVAVSGGKDSLALWDVLATQGYQTAGLYLDLGIGDYSALSRQKAEHFARRHALPLRVVTLADEAVPVPLAAQFTRRAPCAACGKMKRHFFDRYAREDGFTVLATGHNLDDEAARLLGNVLHWQSEYLAREKPVLHPTHPQFVRKVRPLYRLSEFETAAYAFLRGIDYVIDECPNSVDASQLLYKEILNRVEARMPGTKLTFVQEFLRSAQPLFVAPDGSLPRECEVCGMPAFAAVCSFCRLMREVESKATGNRGWGSRRRAENADQPPGSQHTDP
ncbi:MAG: ATP-binding protein [Thermodesulfobacteriota bacterium]|jgi:uncharacterized protein (TIGR00269 family)